MFDKKCIKVLLYQSELFWESKHSIWIPGQVLPYESSVFYT